MLTRFIILSSLVLLCSNLSAQLKISKQLNIEDGLSNNYIKDITQDGQGFVWIATESGLNRFDGKNFTVYSKSNSQIVSNELNTLLYDKNENSIWIGSQRDGISIFDCATQSFKNYTGQDSLVTNDVTHLSHAADGGIWITHYHVGVEHYNKKNDTFTRFLDRDIKGMKSQNWCAADDGKGHLYIGHAYDGLTILDIKSKTARNIRHNPKNPNSLPGNNVRVIYIDSQKRVWIGTDGGLALFNIATDEFITFRHNPLNKNSIGSNHIYDIREMKDGTLWISTDMTGISILNLNNITLIDPQKIQFKTISVTKDSHSLSSSNIRALFQDSYNNIWIGHYHKAIDFISNKAPVFHVLTNTGDIYGIENKKEIWDIHIDKDQQLWIGSENEVSVFQNNKLKRTFNIKPYLSKTNSNIYINEIKNDRNGIIWLGTNNGSLLKINPYNNIIEGITVSEKDDAVHELYEDTDGKIWVGTEDGLYSYHKNIVEKENKINKQLTDNIIHSILRDKEGRLWIGTFGKGIFIFDKKDNLIKKIQKNEIFPSNAINYLYMDSQNGIWAATRNGVVYFNDTQNIDKYKIYNEKQGLENCYIQSFQEDNSGNIWISTNAGISLWNRDDMKFKNYDHRDGIPFGDFISGSASLKKDGTIFFGQLNGICYFNPQDLAKEQQQITPVQIIECLALNKQIENNNKEILIPSTNNKIELRYDQNSFRISFSNPNYSQNKQVEYACMMQGLDNIWYNTQGENKVVFRNIAPGKYTFKVKSRLKNQDWDETNIATLAFIVHPPLWLTWYAKLIYILIIGALIHFILNSYKKKIDLKTSLELERKNSQNKQELNDERLRFYTNITHELRTPLTLIIGPLEDLVQDPKLPAYLNKKINTIHASAIRLLNLINQILEFRKTETQNRKLTVSKGNLASLVTEIGLRFKELNRNDKVTIHIDIDNKDTILYFDADMITTILNNLLSNAMKYTTSGEIRLSLNSYIKDDTPYTEIIVCDTGCGIDKDALPYIFDRYYQVKGKNQASGTGIGLALIKSLVELHEGILHVESTVGKGTYFSFSLLTDNTYPNALHTEDKNKAVFLEKEEEILKEESNNQRPIILVVEDDNDIREYITSSLSEEYQILAATQGKEGWELAQKRIPNIIVSDIMMPEMDGIELCRRIKEDVATCHIPVVLLTAKDSINDREDGYESGADSYLTKPFSAKLLRSRIYNLLESRRKLAEQLNILTKGTILEENNNLKEDSLKINKLDEEFLNKLTGIIEDNLEQEELDIVFIKDKMNMSYSTFYRKVKGLTGISPNEFIRKIRLKNSLQLLLSGSYQVSEVAYMSGFNDVVYFRKCFKDEYGMAPLEYIKSKK